MAPHDTVALAGHIALQTSLDDRLRELEQRAVGLLYLERGLAGVDGAFFDLPLSAGPAVPVSTFPFCVRSNTTGLGSASVPSGRCILNVPSHLPVKVVAV